MKLIKQYYPYLTGVMIGLLVIPLFVRGFGLSWTHQSRLGEVLMVMGLILWPIYIILVFVITFGLKKYQPEKVNDLIINRFRKSTLLAPLGAIISVLVISVLGAIFGG